MKTFLLTKYLPSTYEDAPNTIAINAKYKIHHITFCAVPLYGTECFGSTLCFLLEFEKDLYPG